jgi:hypothetical protein
MLLVTVLWKGLITLLSSFHLVGLLFIFEPFAALLGLDDLWPLRSGCLLTAFSNSIIVRPLVF